MRESSVQREVRLFLGQQPDLVIWRNQVGEAAYYDDNAKASRVPYGLCVGSADNIGIFAPTGRFVAIESKRSKGGKVSDEQWRFLRLVVRMGGFAAVVRSKADAHWALGALRAGQRHWCPSDMGWP